MTEAMQVPETISPYSQGFDASGHSLADLFPEVDPEFKPFGTRVLVQLRCVISQTKSGIVLVQDTKDTEAWNIQVGRVISYGPLAFRRRDTAEPWPEGIWAKVGDFVMVPRWGGERRSIKGPNGQDVVIVLVNDSDLMGAFTGDPLRVKAYIA